MAETKEGQEMNRIVLVAAALLAGCADIEKLAAPADAAIGQKEPGLLERIKARCPELPPADLAELKARTPRPPAPVSKGEVRAWIDRLESGERRKGEAGERIARSYDACRGVAIAPTGS